MVGSSKFPRDCDKEYTLTPEARNKFTECNYILTMPVSSFGDLQYHVDCIPEDELMKDNPEEIYSYIKAALYTIMDSKDQSVALPSNIDIFIQKVYSYFSLRKTKDSFIKEYKRRMDENEPRVSKRKIAKERQEAYEKAQRLGNALTMRGLNEFQDQYIDGATDSTAEEEAAKQVSGTTEDKATQISTTVETATYTTPTKKVCALDKNQKKYVIFNPATFLTAPHKPKIQYIDREKIRDFCEIGMEFLIDDDNYKNEEAMNEYKGYVVDQNKFASFDSFPGVAEFIQDVLSTDKEDFIKMLWNHEKRLEATGTTRTFMDIVCYTLTDFSSNCNQRLRNSNNHERTPFVKYIVPMFKYLSQESNLTEFCWCEKMIESQGLAVSESNDFVVSFSDRKYADGLGRNTITNNEELFIECSSGFDNEITRHSLDDTLKLLVECSNSLLHILKQNKRASIETMTKKCTFGR
ncbi:hypothetical protein INT46_006964 [Mucor plumbeus]|uniref:Uncharacterized protein n=1 Tax=Mucor plumbeus TaxID=97098 RepID=A0A8H7R849_9FUNG|nr:hypothetical protein INT46_006964 [Mucor plumbeus]